MFRIALIDIFLLLLPFLIYGAYMLTVKGVAPDKLWQNAPILWLLTAAIGLLFIVTATVIQFSGGKPGETYHPATLENGVIKPGEID